VRLAIVPAPEMLDEGAARALVEASKAGTKVLITGAVEGDSYGRPTPSLEALGVLGESRPVALHETTNWGAAAGAPRAVTFDIGAEGLGQFGLAQHWLRRGAKPSPTALAGAVWHEPLPLDLARETEPLDALLAAALKAAGVPVHPAADGVAVRVLRAPRAVLVACVNETPAPARRRVVLDGRPFEIPVPALRSRLVLFQRGTGAVLATTPGDGIR
jgi:hypothetical protein